jgi:DNA-directed RNA polymerase alpha subunit
MPNTDHTTLVLVGVEHLPGCTPLKPCKSCVAAKFLRMNMEPEAFEAYVELMINDESKSEEQKLDEVKSRWFHRPVQDLGHMSVRLQNYIKNDNIRTVVELVERTEAQFLRAPNVGRKALNELNEVLKVHGLWLGMVPPPLKPAAA